METSLQALICIWNSRTIDTNICYNTEFQIQWSQYQKSTISTKTGRCNQIYAGQGSTFDEIRMDMDVSSSPTFLTKTGLATYYMCPTHYIVANRVTSLEGLHIINWNGDFLGIHDKVEQLLKSMKEHPLQICYTLTYDLNGDMKVTY